MIQKDIKTAMGALEALPDTKENLLLVQYVTEIVNELREERHNLHISYCRIEELEKLVEEWKSLANGWKERHEVGK